MKKIAFLFALNLIYLMSFSQDSFNQKFLEANTLMEESMFNIALPIWLNLSTENPNNCNVDYKIGVCYINSGTEKKKALPYLEKALGKTSSNYDPFSSSEQNSPIETYYYLARAYHINTQLDSAMTYYNLFKSKISKKHYLFNEVDHNLKQCENAKLFVAKPVNIEVNNLGKTINTEYPEYSPVLSLDESTIYFTSRRLRKDSSNYFIKDVDDGQYFEDIYVSNNYDGLWTEPELLNLNSEGHEATINLSVDGQTLFIYKDDNGNGNLYSSNYSADNQWSTPILLGSDINSEAQETHVAISPDENTLYFVSDRKGGLGGQDIYFCNKLPNGEWAKAQNIGNAINTPYDEDGVFIHPDGKTMYFSSHGHTSMGGYDIFYSIKNEDGTWSTPVNIGYPVNSTDDDVFFVTSVDGKRGYYSSIQEKGFGEKDIYMISLVDAEEKPLTLLTGLLKVIGEKETPSDAQIVITNNLDGSLIGIFKPRKKDGKFSIILEPNIDYHIVYSALTFKQEEDLFVPEVSSFKEINRGIDLQNIIFGAQPTDSLANNTGNETTKDNKNPKDNTNSKDNVVKNNTKDKNENVLSSYQELFNYNVKTITLSNSNYMNFIAKAADIISSGSKITIEIEASASKVPTKTFDSNYDLAKHRGEEAKETILKSLSEKGINSDKMVTFKKIKSLVQGPKYKGDFDNKEAYEKYQYVKITLR